MEIGFLAAFLGGVLALLSPCSALLLPAFLAATVRTKLGLLAHAGVFYLGLLLTLVPFGLGLGAFGSLLLDHRELLVGATAVILVVLGILQVLGRGFDVSRLLPGAQTLRERAAVGSGLARTLLLGAAGGVAGFCAGPILGAILTLAMGQASPVVSGVLMAMYGAGMVLPLTLIAAVWQHRPDRTRALLRGREFTLGGLRLHTTSVLTGVLLIVVGVLFWRTNGLLDVPSLVPTGVQARLQELGASVTGPVLDVLFVLALAAVVLGLWHLARRRSVAADDAPPQGEREP